MRTYEVGMRATALRTFRVRARSQEEAIELAEERANRSDAGSWTLDWFLQTAPETFTVADARTGEVLVDWQEWE